MTLFLITAAVFGVAVFGMAIGVIASNRRLRGTCGGLNKEQGQSACDACQTPTCTTTNTARNTTDASQTP